MKKLSTWITNHILTDKLLLAYMSIWTRMVLNIRKPKIVGTTGTAGKTTVTQMLGYILMQDAAKKHIGKVGKTTGNRNGDYGVRLSILRLSLYPNNNVDRLRLFIQTPFHALKQAFFVEYPKILVLEYGTYSRGHIHDLVKVAPPQVAILTNIGPAHLERHKTVEGVYIEKRALIQAAPADGLVVLGAGHEFVDRLKADSKAPVVVVEGRGAALAQQVSREVGRYFGLPDAIIEEGIKTYKPPTGRLNKFTVMNMTVIDDSYNANPLSMQLGLDTLAGQEYGVGRKVAMIGIMAELGDQSARYHKEIGSYARGKADFIVGVGEGAQDYAPDVWFKTSKECAENIKSLLKDEDVVLIKGSNAANMTVLVDHLKTLGTVTV
jgi:UDP-N-acetylmuramoyl-tripeptide--D-alanyl-D-alanine ligase